MAIYAFFLAGLLTLLAACSNLSPPLSLPLSPLTSSLPAAIEANEWGADSPPPAPREFRAAWISTVANIDWPSRRDLSVAQQQAEIIAILDRARDLNLNALVLQVRPSADAIYPSTLEPWSEFLTGTQGKAPLPFYDPLKMWIDEAHRRGIELHAWFNPYRAQHTASKSALASSHIANTHPMVVKAYGGFMWMDPGEALAAQRTFDVILDVVRRYDIDGVHIDDYFYPYPAPVAATPNASGASSTPPVEADFPDEPSWQNYLAGGGGLTRTDWRRQNVNALIERLYQGIHREKYWVKFGISPFGLGRPDRRPAGIIGFSQYDKLYADVELWLRNGWLDYLAPQLYWPLEQQAQAFEVLLDYWRRENTQARHLWPGLFTSRVDNSATSWPTQEILNQIALARTRPDVRGQLHFSMIALSENRRGLGEQLKAGPYRAAALAPTTPWLDRSQPSAPQLGLQNLDDAAGGNGKGGSNGNGNGKGSSNKVKLKLSSRDGKLPAKYALWVRYGIEWRFMVMPGSRTEVEVDSKAANGALNSVVVSAVDRLGNESRRVRAALPLPAANPTPK